MTDELPGFRPYPELLRVDLTELQEVLKGIPEGWYRTKDLYPRYEAWAKRAGKKPATPKTLGESIVRELSPERRHAHGHVSVFRLSEEVLTGERARPRR